MSTHCIGARGRRLGVVILTLVVAVLLGGCATAPPRASLTSGFGLHSKPRQLAATAAPGETEGAAGGFP
ncbi:MAG TPA: hypothetical protein VEU33_13975, partial [Archangium sp.]|nr:hypothetical protein [Archangium sp.]